MTKPLSEQEIEQWRKWALSFQKDWPFPDRLHTAACINAICDLALSAKRNEADAGLYPAIWLEGAKGHWTVKIEVNKQWITVIKEFHGDGGHSSHIVEPLGIQAAITAAKGSQ